MAATNQLPLVCASGGSANVSTPGSVFVSVEGQIAFIGFRAVEVVILLTAADPHRAPRGIVPGNVEKEGAALLALSL